MNDGHPSEDILQDPIVPDELSSEPSALPRWLQIVVGVILLPFTLLCTAAATTMFGIPKVQSDARWQLFCVAVFLLCVWTVLLSFRLMFGVKGKGLFGPVALRAISVAAIGLITGGFFTGVWITDPLGSAALSISYLLTALFLWKLAAYRSGSVA